MSRLDDAISNVAYILDSLRVYRDIVKAGDCNTCKISSTCPYVPKAGQLVRYNCPLHVKAEQEKETELKPCPFCGGRAVLVQVNRKNYVICDDCGAKSFEYSQHDDYFDARAIRAWNRRANENET